MRDEMVDFPKFGHNFVRLCSRTNGKGITLHQDDTPSLPEEPPSLASQYDHPDKDLIPLFSRYKINIKHVK